jgi:hypothetical protein
MNGASDYLFTRTGLAQNEDTRIVRSNFADEAIDLPHDLGPAGRRAWPRPSGGRLDALLIRSGRRELLARNSIDCEHGDDLSMRIVSARRLKTVIAVVLTSSDFGQRNDFSVRTVPGNGDP